MNTISIAFLLTTLAGLATIIGTIPIFIPLKNENKMIAGCLAFASGIMLSVSILDLIPESITMLSKNINRSYIFLCSFLFIFLGIIISSFINNNIEQINGKNTLYKIGLISMLTIILHNIPEGIATFISTTKNTSLGISMTIAIALHNIPEGISISVPIYYGIKSKKKALEYTFVSALSEPLGAVITYVFLLPIINNLLLGLLFSLIAGMMIQISMSLLLPTSYQYGYTKITNSFFGLGFLVMSIKFVL